MLIEIQTFRVRPGVDESAFVEADARAQTDFYYRQPGLTRRTTARSPAGDWLVVVLWESPEAADAAAGRAGDDQAVSELMSLMEEPEIRRYSSLD